MHLVMVEVEDIYIFLFKVYLGLRSKRIWIISIAWTTFDIMIEHILFLSFTHIWWFELKDDKTVCNIKVLTNNFQCNNNCFAHTLDLDQGEQYGWFGLCQRNENVTSIYVSIRPGKCFYASTIRQSNLSNFRNIWWPEKASNCPFEHYWNLKYPFLLW